MDIVPEHKSRIALNTDARIGPNLSFKDAGGRACTLRKIVCAFLEQIQCVER